MKRSGLSGSLLDKLDPLSRCDQGGNVLSSCDWLETWKRSDREPCTDRKEVVRNAQKRHTFVKQVRIPVVHC